MKQSFLTLNLCSALLSLALVAAAQEHKHEEAKPQKDTAPNKNTPPAKDSAMACCEMMQKMGEVKDGAPMKHEMPAEMKAKMEKMKADMKQKMAEKMQGPSAGEKPEKKSDGAAGAEKNAHQH